VLPALYLRFGAGGRPMQPLRYALERMRRRGRLEAEPVVAGAVGNVGTDMKVGTDSPESSSNGGIDDGERGAGAHEPVV
jgi:hypothetical protein